MIKCLATTNNLTINTEGFIKPCCKYRGNFGHIDKYTSISEILNSNHYENLKKQHSLGNFTNGCKNCKKEEERKYLSYRQQINNRLEGGKFLFDISVSTHCNLKCRMCGPTVSTKWHEDYKKLVNSEADIWSIPKEPGIYNTNNSHVQMILDFIKNNNYHFDLEIKGGEPLSNPTTKKFIKDLANTEKSKNISIFFVTNGTYECDWLIDLVPKFKKFKIYVSIDGIENVFEYIRGSNIVSWKNFLEKFNTYKSLPIFINYVIQNLNVHQLYKFSKYFDKVQISWIVLIQPSILSINVIPKNARSHILKEISPMLYTYKDNQTIKNVINELKKEDDLDKKLYTKFIKYSAALDKIRNQSLLDVAPHLITDEGLKIYESV